MAEFIFDFLDLHHTITNQTNLLFQVYSGINSDTSEEIAVKEMMVYLCQYTIMILNFPDDANERHSRSGRRN